MSAWSRPVVLLLCGLLLLTISIAILNTLVPLWLTHAFLPTWQTGIVSSAFYSGNLLGTLLAGRLISRLGFNYSYIVASIIFALATAFLGLSSEFQAWAFWRFIAGIGCALIWVVVESALLCCGSVRSRGQLLAAYMIVYYLGTVAGQLLVSRMPGGLLQVLPWVTVVTAIAILPLIFCKITAQNQSDEHNAPRIWSMLRRPHSRLGINGCVISGIMLGSLYGLMPVWLTHRGMSDASVGYWMALLVSAGIIGQWPVGCFADRFGRLAVLRTQVAVIIIGALAMLSNVLMAPGMFILGCACFTLYPVAMSWACENIASHELVAMNQSLLLSYTIGSLFGPGVTAMLMQNYSDRLLFVMIAAVALIYLWMLLHQEKQHATPVAHA